jgi:hypothetical protein
MSFVPMMAPGPAPMLRSGDAAGLSSHTVTLKDLVDAKLLFPGDEMTFKHEKGSFHGLFYRDGTVSTPDGSVRANPLSRGLYTLSCLLCHWRFIEDSHSG